MLVYKDVTLAAFFSPDLLDCVLPLPVPLELLSWLRQCSAIARKSLPFHHTRPGLRAKEKGRSQISSNG